MLEIKNFEKSYKNKALFSDVNQSFEKGKIYYIFGDNGIGKTTLFRCILGLEKYHGVINKRKLDQFCVFDQPFFYSNLSGLDNLIIFTRNFKIQSEILIDEYSLPLDLLKNTKVKDYSLGERKMLSIMLMLLIKPSVILLDEILNGLDQENRKLLFKVLTEIKKNSVILMTGHDQMYLEIVDELLVIEGLDLKHISVEKLKEKFFSGNKVNNAS